MWIYEGKIWEMPCTDMKSKERQLRKKREDIRGNKLIDSRRKKEK